MAARYAKPAPAIPLELVASLEQKSDDALCRDFLRGNAAAFGELVRRHQRLVFRIARRYCDTPDEAFDLSQRAFLQAFEAAHRALRRLGQGGAFAFRPWLLRIAVNLGKNLAREKRRWIRASEEEAQPLMLEHASAPEELERKQRQALARAKVHELSQRQREVFTLRVDGGLSFSEIAEVLGIQEGNAKTHFHYAVKRLKELLEEAR